MADRQLQRRVASVLLLFVVLVFCLVLAARLWVGPSSAQAPPLLHPLDPLTKEEIATAVAVLKESGKLSADDRFATINLEEPPKEQVLADLKAGTAKRAAFALLYNWATRVTSEVVVDLNKRELISWKGLEQNEPPMRSVLINRLEEVVKADPRWVEAARRRGIDDFSRVSILARIQEAQKLQERNGDRFVTAMSFLRDIASEAAVLTGLDMEVNLTKGTLSRFNDGGGRQSAPQSAGERPALPPLQILQPNGPGFRLRGTEILWQNWRLRYGVHPRRGLEIHDVAYQDGERWRSILYRASISEMIAPYGDPAFSTWYPQDEGDYGLASYSRNSVVPLNDAPDNAVFASAMIADDRGNAVETPRAVAIYERDGGLLWRHGLQSRRARKLVLTAYATIDNYDYAFNWIFGQDATIEVEVMLTGMMNIRGVADRREDEAAHLGHPMLGHLVAPRVNAPNHQHFFSFRLDFDIDGAEHNSVLELNTQSVEAGKDNPKGEAFSMTASLLKTELEAKRMLNLATSRKWKIVSTRRTNALGQLSGYALLPGENSVAYSALNSAPSLRAGFINTHLWVTPYSPNEMFASGDYINLNPVGQGLPKWTTANRKLDDKDVVVWYTLGVTHIPRTEDWPIMPVHPIGFRLVPAGFFSQNPAMDVPAAGR